MGRSRQRQARLAFTPLPSSSPASKDYPKQIQERAAAVAIAGSPRSSNLEQRSRRYDSGQHSVLTPDASAKKSVEHDSDDEIIVLSGKPQRSSPSQPSNPHLKHRFKPSAKQRRLDFSGARDSSSFDAPVTLTSSSHAPASSAGIFAGKRRETRRATVDSTDEEELPSPQHLTSSLRVTRSSHRSQTEEPDSEGDDVVSQSRRPQLIEDESEDNEDEDEMPTTMGTQRKQLKRKRAESVESFIVSSPPPAIESDDDLEIIEPPKRGRQDESDEDEDVTPVTPRRRLKRKRPINTQEEEDLAEDLEFLEPSSDVESARKPRSSQSAKKTAHQKALERLKRQRSGQPAIPEATEEEEEEGPIEIDGSESEEGDSDDLQGHAPVSSRQMFAEDEEDGDFIDEEDNDDPLGVPEGIPLEFTRYGAMKGKELFKFAVEWMVQKKINPAFAMEDEIYILTFKKLADEVTGLAGSKFTSSMWTKDFTLALRSRPEIAFEPIDRNQPEHFMRDHCDACNRSGHPATYQMQFSGTPYDPTTLEEVGLDSDEDSDDEESPSTPTSRSATASNKPAYNHRGEEIPPAARRFYVGKFCKANAETAHSLHHWRQHLYDSVETSLIRRGHNRPDKIVARDAWSTRKRRKYANKIVDRMAREGEIKRLWRSFRENIDHARDVKLAGRFGGR